MSNEKKYIGSGKQVGEYDMINVSISEDKVKDHWFEYKGQRYLKITVAKRKEADQYGKTHTVFIDEYEPKEKVATTPPKKEEENDLPF